MALTMAATFQCTLVTPKQQVLDEPVVYASIPAWDGQIGVAPMRAPLLVKMDDGPLRLDGAGGKAQWFFVAGGFGQMNDNRLTLLTDEAIGIDQIDRQEVEAAYREAEALRAVDEQAVARRNRQLNRARRMLWMVEQKPRG